MTITIYHNPRCSKSRETLKLLQEHHIDFTKRLYLQETITKEEISNLIKLLGFSSARELMRIKESIYKELSLKDESNEDNLIKAMIENPKLIERPIVVIENKVAKIGRPPESVLELFN